MVRNDTTVFANYLSLIRLKNAKCNIPLSILEMFHKIRLALTVQVIKNQQR